jgi:hypothetical protein
MHMHLATLRRTQLQAHSDDELLKCGEAVHPQEADAHMDRLRACWRPAPAGSPPSGQEMLNLNRAPVSDAAELSPLTGTPS